MVQEVIELLDSFRNVMRRNFETFDVEKIQERWSITFHGLILYEADTALLGVVVTSHGFSVKDGKNYLKTSAMLNKRSLIPHVYVTWSFEHLKFIQDVSRFLSCTTRLNIARFTTGLSFLLYLTSMAALIPNNLLRPKFMSYMVMQRLFSTW